MKLKHIDILTPKEVDYCISTWILQKEHDPYHKYSCDWELGGPIIEKYLIGSEGSSAWVWLNGRNYGMVGSTQLDACMKALLFSRYPSGMVRIGSVAQRPKAAHS